MTPLKSRAACERLDFERLELRFALAGMGLTAQYFHNEDFTGLADSRTEAVNYNWAANSPGAGIEADSFSVRWTGQIQADFTQTYTFRLLNDEQARVWIDGQLVIDDWVPHLRRLRSGTIDLVAGQKYDIRVDYVDRVGAAQIELSWFSAGQTLEIIPAENLFESPSGLKAAYSDTTGGTVGRIDNVVDFNWGLAAPNGAIDRDGFTVNWSGQIRADFSEEYTFSTISDGRVRLSIGNELLIENWVDHPTSEDQATKWLEAGKWYDVRLEFYDAGGAAEIEWRWSSLRQTGVGVFEVIPQANLRAASEAEVTFRNPLGVGADPFVVQWQSNYYMTMTTDARSVSISRAPSLQDIHPDSAASDTIVAWTPPPGTSYDDEVWAPELHRLGDKWYIYVAASNGSNENHRMHVLERSGPDPFGSYTYVGQIAAQTNRWAIDGTVLQWQGINYFVWSGWEGTSDGQQNLYIAEMRNPWTIRGDRFLISSPQYSWEKVGLPINEGPQILINNGQLHIVYSASGYWTPDYALGLLTYNGTGSLLIAASWAKASQPVFQSSGGVVGVGHASFTVSPDGTEHWIVYHAHRSPAAPPGEELRDVRIQPFTFSQNGTPNFGPPLPLTQPIPIPSDGPDAERPFINGDYNADGIVDADDRILWRATFGAILFPGISAEANGNGEVDAADFIVWRKAMTASATTASAMVMESVDIAIVSLSLPQNTSYSEFNAAGNQPDRPSQLPALSMAFAGFDEQPAHLRAKPSRSASIFTGPLQFNATLPYAPIVGPTGVKPFDERAGFKDDRAIVNSLIETDRAFALLGHIPSMLQRGLLLSLVSEAGFVRHRTSDERFAAAIS